MNPLFWLQFTSFGAVYFSVFEQWQAFFQFQQSLRHPFIRALMLAWGNFSHYTSAPTKQKNK